MNYLLLFMLAFALAWGAVYFVMPTYIRNLQRIGANQRVSEYALDDFKEKAKTPIMGGLLFVIFPMMICILVKPNILMNRSSLFVLLSYFLFGVVGFWDDVLILIRKNNDGLAPKKKLFLQLIFAAALCFFFQDSLVSLITIPFFKMSLPLGIFYLPFAVLLFTTEANAVNFTDGMDGLCAGVSFIGLIPFVFVAFRKGQMDIALIVIAVMAGLMAYLSYNLFPAKIFMGDSGSLALGGLFTSVALVLNSEIVLFFAGGIFVWEMFCVVLQLSSVKLFKRRIFSYTPIHYAFKLKGISEKKIVESFYVLAGILSLVAIVIGVWG